MSAFSPSLLACYLNPPSPFSDRPPAFRPSAVIGCWVTVSFSDWLQMLLVDFYRGAPDLVQFSQMWSPDTTVLDKIKVSFRPCDPVSWSRLDNCWVKRLFYFIPSPRFKGVLGRTQCSYPANSLILFHDKGPGGVRFRSCRTGVWACRFLSSPVTLAK